MNYPEWFVRWHMRMLCRLYGHQASPYYVSVPEYNLEGWSCAWCRKIEDKPWA